MALIPVCDGLLNIASGPSAPFQCYEADGITVKPWRFIEYVEPSTSTMDFSGLVDLLSFDPEMCALLIGICVLFFIIGHSAGHVARNLGRV